MLYCSANYIYIYICCIYIYENNWRLRKRKRELSTRQRTVSVKSGENTVAKAIRQPSEMPDQLIKEEEAEVGKVRLWEHRLPQKYCYIKWSDIASAKCKYFRVLFCLSEPLFVQFCYCVLSPHQRAFSSRIAGFYCTLRSHISPSSYQYKDFISVRG